MEVQLHPEAMVELGALPPKEHAARLNAIAKLEALGADLGYPHTSQVQGSTVRELRPRGGRSPWRAFYRRVGDVLVIGAIGPEAQSNERGSRAAVERAVRRLDS